MIANTKKIVLSFLFLLIGTTLFSQIAPDTILVDFLNIKNITKYKQVKNEHKYILKIENVNQSLFKIESNISQQEFNIEMPDIFSGIKLPTYLNLTLPNTPQDVALTHAVAAPRRQYGRN
jgi:hypothetical protein